MFVCICNAIRDSELREAVRRCQQRPTADGLYTALGRPPQCRQCLDDAEEIILDEHQAMPLQPVPSPPMPMRACA